MCQAPPSTDATEDSKNATHGSFLESQYNGKGGRRKAEVSELDQRLQPIPFSLCALTPFIILPRAAIVSVL